MALLKHIGVLNQSFLDEFFISYHGLKSKMTANKLSYLTVLHETDGLGSSRAELGESGPDIPFSYKKNEIEPDFFCTIPDKLAKITRLGREEGNPIVTTSYTVQQRQFHPYFLSSRIESGPAQNLVHIDSINSNLFHSF